MRHVLAIALGLCAVCTLLIGSAVCIPRLSGRYTLPWLENTGCALPCWHLITPGVSSFDEAARQVSTIAGVDQMTISGRSELYITWSSFAFETPRGRIFVQMRGKSSARIETISFYPGRVGNMTTLLLADLVARFGAPQVVTLSGQGNRLYHFGYGTLDALVFIPYSPSRRTCDRLTATAGVSLAPKIASVYVEHWHGFTSLFDAVCNRSP